MTDTFTEEHRTKLEQYLSTHELPSGFGSKESACSIAAINLAIKGELTDTIPACMSEVLGQATIKLQDAMPDVLRNSNRYKALLPNMAGTGRDKEQERLGVLLDWMWVTVLPQLQDTADTYGFGVEWSRMCRERSHDAAARAYTAADAAVAAAARAAAAYAADAARAAAAAARAAAAYAADAARAAAAAADAATYAAAVKNRDAFWQVVDPIGLLERMTYLEDVSCQRTRFSCC